MSWISPHIAKMTSYIPGFQPQKMTSVVKLNTNESPYPPPQAIQDFLKTFPLDSLRSYPDPNATALKEKIAQKHNLNEKSLLIGNGSDEILSILVRSCVQAGESILFPQPTYSLYETLCDIQNVRAETVPFHSQDGLCLETLARSKAKILFLANPNSPTGIFLKPTVVEKISLAFSGLCVIDEAYVDFAEDNCLSLVEKHQNLLVVRTFSKSHALAGIRLGWVCASPSLIREFSKVKDSYNVNILTQKIGEVVLDCETDFKRSLQKIKNTRESFFQFLLTQQWTVTPSQANFLWGSPPCNAKELYKHLKDKNIFLRYFKDSKDHLRITIGSPEQMSVLKKALRDYHSDPRKTKLS